jgi:flagellar protein FlaG
MDLLPHRQEFAAFLIKRLKFRTMPPNHGHDTPILVTRHRGKPIVSSVSGGARPKDHIMSQDISPTAPRMPAAAGVSQAARTAEAATRLPQTDTPAPAVQAKPDPQEARRALQEAAEQLNQQMSRNKRDLSFSVDDVANTVVITVKNTAGEVVRQIPNEAALRVAHNLENIKGLLQDDKS